MHLRRFTALPLLLLVAPVPAPPLWKGTIDLTIGEADAVDPTLNFEEIAGIDFSAEGRIFVVDRKANEIRVFSPTGKFESKIGRKGEGPGDLSGPCCLSLSPQGEVWVREFTNHRYSIFTFKGGRLAFSRAITLADAANLGSSERVRWDGRGLFLDMRMLPFKEGSPAGLNRRFLDASGKIVRSDTIPEPPADSVKSATNTVTTAAGTGSSTVSQPFGPSRLRAMGPNGESALAMSSNYAVTWYDQARKPIALLQNQVTPLPLTAEERQEASATIAAVEKRWGERLPFGVPERKPLLAGLGFDLEGRLWVERTVAEGMPHLADVYDRTHKLVATAQWPSRVQLDLWAIRGRTAVGTVTDSLGTVQVVRLRF